MKEQGTAKQCQGGINHAGDRLDGDYFYRFHFPGKGDLFGLADKDMIEGAEQALGPAW